MVRRPSHPRRGAATVEFALVLPLLLILLCGIWEIGRVVEVQQIMKNAAREGGRQASTGQKSVDQIKQNVIDYLQKNNLDTTGISVTVTNMTDGTRADPRTADQMDRFRVELTLPFKNVQWAALNHVYDGSDLTAAADWTSMRDIPLTVSGSVPVE